MENVENVEQEKEEVVKTYSEEEVAKLVQSEADKRVNQALEKKQAEWQEQYKATLEEEKRKAAMTEEERWKEEFNKQKAEFEKERSEFTKAQLKASTLETLAKEALPASMVEFVIAEDAETTQARIELFKEAWTDALAKEVNERLKGNTPKVSNTDVLGASEITKEQFRKMGYKDRIKLQEENPTLFKMLSE